MGPAGDFHLGYRRWLDGLRGLAILSVLSFHLGLLPGGSLGVDIFFVLSGFLITVLLVEEWQQRGSISLKAFYLRRALRLLPAFLTLLLILGLSSLLLEPAAATVRRREMIVAGCYVANWPTLHRTEMVTLGHTWSLSVEEQFYLLWPMLLYVLLRLQLRRRRILLLVCAGILASATLRLVLYRVNRIPGEENWTNILRLYMGLDTRADALLVGCLLGLLAAWRLLPTSQRFIRWSGGAALVSLGALGYLAWVRCLDHSQYYHGLFTVVALMVAVIIAPLLSGPSRAGRWILESAPLVGLGRISYGTYLYHIPIICWIRSAQFEWGFVANTLLAVTLTLAAALLSYYCVERPCLRLKDRWHPQANSSPSEVGPPIDEKIAGITTTAAAA
jgi:peptidoglycan/LPS O-acetylase OafA/YrhL